MSTNHRLAAALIGLGLVLTSACGGPSSSNSSGGSAGQMQIVEVSNGFGRLLPYQVFRVDDMGVPTGQTVAITTQNTLLQNVVPGNEIQPVTTWRETAVLSDGTPGNHFIFARFQNDIDSGSVFDALPTSSTNNFLRGAITVVAVDPVEATTTVIPGRAFIGGRTIDLNSVDPETGLVNEVQWVESDGTLLDARGAGFPGISEAGFPRPNFADLIATLTEDSTFLFIPDADDNLATFETFPSGVQIRMQITTGVQSTNGRFLRDPGVASSTVGEDNITPEVVVSGNFTSITPGNEDTDVDPTTAISIEFTEPIQLSSIGSLVEPNTSSAVQIQFGSSAQVVTVPFVVEVPSVFDLTRINLVPGFNFPGASDDVPECGDLNNVTVRVNANQFADLKLNDEGSEPNLNTLNAQTNFQTGEGPGIVNAPVCPDAIYLGRVSSSPSISVIDLNGFGATTGTPAFDENCRYAEGNTNYPNNPNVQQGAILIPPLQPGTCTVDGGSAGIFSLTKDSNLSDRLATAPLLDSVEDIQVGHALDATFNNGPPPFGCQAQGGNNCADSATKQLRFVGTGPNTIGPLASAGAGQFAALKTLFGVENSVSWAPHPNPPPLSFPPTCLSPFIGGQEPTSIDTEFILGLATNNLNQLVPNAGLLLGQPEICAPPRGLLAREQNTWFQGPSLPSGQQANCQVFSIRQQVGNFLYVIDRARREVVIFNSNRFTVIDRIPLQDPTRMAMSPNIDFLAVTNQAANIVSFIDIDPSSTTFHQVVKNTLVGSGPTGIAWQPDNEDIIVCNTSSSSISIISAFDLEVRKTVSSQLNAPFDITLTHRQILFGFQRQVYYGFILNRDGTIAIFESGPDGQNGWGFNDIIGKPAFQFPVPKGLIDDPLYINGGCWVIHEQKLGPNGSPTGLPGGAISELIFESATFGQQPLNTGPFLSQPSLRDLEFRVRTSIGSDQLTGVPFDVTFDEQMNRTGLDNLTNIFGVGPPATINGKSLLRADNLGGVPRYSYTPQFMFLAVPFSDEGPGVVDVIQLSGFVRFDTNPFEPGIQSIPAPGVRVVSSFFR